jgi:hypothetical protein
LILQPVLQALRNLGKTHIQGTLLGGFNCVFLVESAQIS